MRGVPSGRAVRKTLLDIAFFGLNPAVGRHLR